MFWKQKKGGLAPPNSDRTTNELLTLGLLYNCWQLGASLTAKLANMRMLRGIADMKLTSTPILMVEIDGVDGSAKKRIRRAIFAALLNMHK